MDPQSVPQPSPERLVPFVGHPAVVGIVPNQPDLVCLTALAWASAMSAPSLHFAYVDTSRYAVEELPDGDVMHAPIDPDDGDRWEQTETQLNERLTRMTAGHEVAWRLHYLAGRPDRALTHLARAVDAAVYIVGTRAPGPGRRWHEILEGSVAAHLAHHQHRPVLTVPLDVVDWAATTSSWDRP